MLWVGIAFLVIAVGIYVMLFRAGKQLERAEYERTNSDGVEEFDNYDEMARARRKSGLFKIVATLCTFLIIGLVLMGVIMIVSGL